MLALILTDRSWLAAIGTALKVYAFTPLAGEGRWRTIGVALAVNAATFVIAPGLWLRYVGLFGTISGRLAYRSNQGFSAFYFPALLAVTVVALGLLALRDRRTAGWLAVPALWPSSQLHYSMMALPVMSPLLAFFLAIPVFRLPPEIIIVEAVPAVASPNRDRLSRSPALENRSGRDGQGRSRLMPPHAPLAKEATPPRQGPPPTNA